MKTLAELRSTEGWKAAEYLETRGKLMAANMLQPEVALNGVLENYHAERLQDTISEWYTDVPAVELAVAIETDCPGIEATVESDDLIRIALRQGWTWIPESELGLGELLGE